MSLSEVLEFLHSQGLRQEAIEDLRKTLEIPDPVLKIWGMWELGGGIKAALDATFKEGRRQIKLTPCCKSHMGLIGFKPACEVCRRVYEYEELENFESDPHTVDFLKSTSR